MSSRHPAGKKIIVWKKNKGIIEKNKEIIEKNKEIIEKQLKNKWEINEKLSRSDWKTVEK